MGKQGLDLFRQADQAQQVGNGRARLADRFRDLLLGQLELLLQALQGSGFLDRVEVLALDVLDQRHGDGRFVRHVAHQRRDLFQSGLLAGPPAPLAGNDLVAAIGDRPHHDGLHHALGLDRLRQFLQRLRVHVATRLVLAALHQVEGDLLQLAAVGLYGFLLQFGGTRAAQQGIEPASQSTFLGCHAGSLCGCLS